MAVVWKTDLFAPADSFISLQITCRDLEKFILALSNSEIKFGCIQSLDQLESLAEGRIRAALIQKFTGFLPSQIQPTTVV